MLGFCRPTAIGVLVSFALIACGGGDSATPTPTVAPPAFTESSCPVVTPAVIRVTCGYLTVPMNRQQPGEGSVQLAVAIFKAQSESTDKPDPILYLDGGPGVPTLQSLPQEFTGAISDFLVNRDFIVFDQRGTGLSRPALECPEINALSGRAVLEYMTSERFHTEYVETVRDCRDRLTGLGVDPVMANSLVSAADVEDLRIALGYESWNLMGASYGTRLALTIMRDYPQHVRSAILDSTYPLEVDLFSAQPENYDRALHVLFADCAADSVCSEENPNLEDRFFDTLNRLNNSPYAIDPEELFSLVDQPIVLSGDLFSLAVYESLYYADIIPSLPDVITAAYDFDYGGIGFIFETLQTSSAQLSMGTYLSVQCSDEAPFTSAEQVRDKHRDYAVHGAFRGLADDFLDACAELNIPSPSPLENEPVTSDIPTLILSGAYDPITPPAWGKQVAGNLANSFFYEFPDIGHGVVSSSDCASAVAGFFLDDPSREPQRSCLDRLEPPDFSESFY